MKKYLLHAAHAVCRADAGARRAVTATPVQTNRSIRTPPKAGMAEVEVGTLAQQKGKSTAARRDFGAMMVKDHTAANSKLEAIAAGKGGCCRRSRE